MVASRSENKRCLALLRVVGVGGRRRSSTRRSSGVGLAGEGSRYFPHALIVVVRVAYFSAPSRAGVCVYVREVGLERGGAGQASYATPSNESGAGPRGPSGRTATSNSNIHAIFATCCSPLPLPSPRAPFQAARAGRGARHRRYGAGRVVIAIPS